ncbi:hypothetical protein [Nitratidesulfovibrio sp. 1201_IL3209]|uniref:hypothetical protein n=1 Tax=Nitratidesulfovibrio sp. 1201_IL3209 TaxID=3084053 RepID=UPI002FDB2BA1
MIVRVADAEKMLCGRYNQACRGTRCMQFRVMVPGTVPDAEERESTGYCGLGGMPTVKALHVPEARGQRGMPEVEPYRGGMVHAGAAVPTIIHTVTPLTASHITPRTRAMERLILQGPDGGKFFEAAEASRDNGGRPVVVVTPSEAAVLHGSCGECAGEDCPGCVGG